MEMNDVFLNTFIQKQTGLINDLQARLLLSDTKISVLEGEIRQLSDQKAHHERELSLVKDNLVKSEEKKEDLKNRLKQYHKANEELTTELNSLKIKSSDDINDLTARTLQAEKAANHYREYAESIQKYVPQAEPAGQNEDLRNQPG